MPRAKAVRAIIIVNVIVFLFWYIFDVMDSPFMENNFLVSWDGLMAGRVWTLITAVFSHNMIWHILINMLVLASFGSVLEIVLGRKRFLIFYFAAGIFSSLCHALVSAFVLGAPDLPALGASGAISGLVLVFALMFPKQKLLLFGIIPAPALWGALAFVALDLWGLSAQAHGGGMPIGHGAHLGGALAGIIYYFGYVRRRWPRNPISPFFVKKVDKIP